MDSWENTEELPTKFNKYRRLYAKEAAQAQTKGDTQETVTEHSCVNASYNATSIKLTPDSISHQPANFQPELFASQPVFNTHDDVTYARPPELTSRSIAIPRNAADIDMDEKMDCSPVSSQSLDNSHGWAPTSRLNGSPSRDFFTRADNFVSEERVCRSPRMPRTDSSPYRTQYDRSPLGQRLHHQAARHSRIDDSPRQVGLPYGDGRVGIGSSIGLGSCPMLDMSSLAAVGNLAASALGNSMCRCGVCRQCKSNFRSSSSAGTIGRSASCRNPPVSIPTADGPLDLTSRAQTKTETRYSSRPLVVQRTVLTSEGSSSQVVDEHFERSLGATYSQLLKYPSAPSSAPPTSPSSVSGTVVDAGIGTSLISVTGSVDDHFSKSLGDVWRQMKENVSMADCQQAPTAGTAMQPRVEVVASAGSVDDHFAKALGGETWQRIKADQEQAASRSTSVPPAASSNTVHFYQT